MEKIKINVSYQKLIADTLTPVAIYLKLRDKFQNAILLESSDYHGSENSYSYICCNPTIGFEVNQGVIRFHTSPDKSYTLPLHTKNTYAEVVQQFCNQYELSNTPLNFTTGGLFGYTAYDAISHFEDIVLDSTKPTDDIPAIMYYFYETVIVINHFNDELYIIKHQVADYEDVYKQYTIDYIITLLNNKNISTYHFAKVGEQSSNFDDAQFLDIIKKGIDHCYRGDVFQIVLSRRFSQSFSGDDFNLYRALRSINPSPYLYYFDYGNFKIFGSSPEAQLIIKNNTSLINPIAGTFKRTGNDDDDRKLAQKLSNDPKENSEHIMLVDLARNDLSRNGTHVQVETYKEVQYYSHVIHLVSKVTGQLSNDTNKIKVIADTFPAGTLSGAPKHMAMTLINKYENINRGYYGGCIGFMDFDGNFNQAIVIRSFLSMNNTLHFQAGAGVVADSVPESELNEVHNKLAALNKALDIAHEL
ncbi:MAG: anthranilate synthase component I family protein [Cytophagales bacterium]|nr:anthranilate synthase component I family protein [Cytophagales bacterium]